MNFKTVLFLVCGLCFSFSVFAQKATIRGYIYDADNGQPVIYANIYLLGTDLGTTSDANGFFNISDVPAGKFQLIGSYIGYDTLRSEVTVVKSEIIQRSLYMKSSGITLGEVKISASRERAKSEVQVSKIVVTPKQIKSLPSIGGDADIAQYLQILPGIISTGDQGGQIFIRGGSPVQNKILLDGLNIYNPFHSLGFFSVFETELIRNVDVFTGGFNAEYGGRVSAIIDIKTREGNKSRLSGYTSISPFMGKILIEAPLNKFEQGKGSTSFVVTGKKSLIDRTSKSLYSYAADVDSIGLPFSFSDFYSKFSVVSGNGSKFNLFGFNFTDGYNNPLVASIGWENTGVGADFTMVPNSSDIIIKGTIGYTNYDLGIKDSADKRSSSIREFGATVDFTIFRNKSEFKYGFDLRAVKTDFNFINPYKILLSQEQNTTEFSTYLKYRQTIGRVVIEPSVRLMYYASQARFSPEPRMGLKYNITDNFRFKAAGGFYSQNVMGTSNERDVVNLFYGFLTSPESSVKGLDGKNLDNKLQLARHAVGGFEIDVSDNLQLNVETYIKDFNQLIVVNRNKVSINESDYAVETGKAYGVDFSAKYEEVRYNLFAAYSYGFVNRFDGEQTYPTVFDRRHNLNMLATYNFDRKGDLQFSIRWNMGSGFPFTKTQGFYNQLSFVDGANTNYLQENPDQVGIIYSQLRNGGRLPYYHRLDLSLSKKFHFSKYTHLELNASITNAYDRENIFYFDRIKYSRVNQLPVMPALSAKFAF
ncbi:MAG: TonB-dependent receptor [Saprospiraceae bacterium]|nr:TonB-dependent receptor [Saprospiraceae bacterium]